MKDNISLIAAAAGGFMLSLAAASIIKAAPIAALQVQPRLTTPAADLRHQPLSPNKPVGYLNQKVLQYQKSKSKQEIQASWHSAGIAD